MRHSGDDPETLNLRWANRRPRPDRDACVEKRRWRPSRRRRTPPGTRLHFRRPEPGTVVVPSSPDQEKAALAAFPSRWAGRRRPRPVGGIGRGDRSAGAATKARGELLARPRVMAPRSPRRRRRGLGRRRADRMHAERAGDVAMPRKPRGRRRLGFGSPFRSNPGPRKSPRILGKPCPTAPRCYGQAPGRSHESNTHHPPRARRCWHAGSCGPDVPDAICRDGCPRKDKNCLNACSQEYGRCLKECDRRCK
jgi:hypothetical protein